MDFIVSIDIILTINEFLPIHDTRNLLRCNKRLNSLVRHSNKNILSIVDINSLNWENKLNSTLVNSIIIKSMYLNYSRYIKRENLYKIEKYTFEIICYGYIHLLPNRYVFENNMMFHGYNQIDLNAGYNNFLDLIKFKSEFVVNRYTPHYFCVAIGAIMDGNLKILKLLKQRKYIFWGSDWTHAIKAQQLRVLTWSEITEYSIKTMVLNNAIANRHLNILKWACKYNYIDKNIYWQVTSNS